MIAKLLLLSLLSAADSLASWDRATAPGPADVLSTAASGVYVDAPDGLLSGERNVYIRGLNTVRGDGRPLFVVDGVRMDNLSRFNISPVSRYEDAPVLGYNGSLAGLSAYDIQSVEIIKDMSAAARYGARGANGVILINTRGQKPGVQMSSNLGLTMGGGVQQNHYASTAGSSGQTSWSLSGWYRRTEGKVRGEDSGYLGISASAETHANKSIWLDATIHAAMGNISSPALTNHLRPYRDDGHDDDTKDYNASASVSLHIGLLPVLSWETQAGSNIQSLDRVLWWGSNTPFGAPLGGVAANSSTTVASYNASSMLVYNRYVGTDHRVSASAGVQTDGAWTGYNNMAGNEFFSETLRGKGLSLMNSARYPAKYQFDRSRHEFVGSASYAWRDIFGAEAVFNVSRSPRYQDDYTLYPGLSVWARTGSVRWEAGAGKAGEEMSLPYDLSVYFTSQRLDIPQAVTHFFEGYSLLSSREAHVGAEASLWRDRAHIAAKYYYKSTKDAFNYYSFGTAGQIYWLPSARETSFSGTDCTVLNAGVELDWDVLAVRSGEWTWQLQGHAAYNKGMTDSPCGEDAIGTAMDGTPLAHMRGEAASSIIGYKTASDGSLTDINRDGRITAADRIVLGGIIPTVTGSMNSTLKYGPWTLDAVLCGAAGHHKVDWTSLRDAGGEVCDRFVSRADFLSLQRVSLSWRIPVKWRYISSMDVSMSTVNWVPHVHTVFAGIFVKL